MTTPLKVGDSVRFLIPRVNKAGKWHPSPYDHVLSIKAFQQLEGDAAAVVSAGSFDLTIRVERLVKA